MGRSNPLSPWHTCLGGKSRPGSYEGCDKCRDMKRGWELEGEEWRPIPIAPGYLASNFGRVKHANPSRKPIKPCPDKDGYPRTTLVVNGKKTPLQIHKMVAETWLGPREPGIEVNHIDGDKTNSRVSNLEYVTRKENLHHAIRTGLWNPNWRAKRNEAA